jgi:hypothetical protein
LIEISVLRARERALEVLRAAPGEWTAVEHDSSNETLRFEVQADEQQLAEALRLLTNNGIPVTNFYEVPADLEDVFMSLTK